MAQEKVKLRSTDNQSGMPDSQIVLPETVRNQERAERVTAMVQSGDWPTRRAARRHLNKSEGRR